MIFDDAKSPFADRPILRWALLFSLGLHALVMVYRFARSEHVLWTPPDEKKESLIEMTELSPEMQEELRRMDARPKQLEPEIAESEKTDNDEIDPNARFLGEKNQKVTKQEKAKRIDDFRAKTGTGAKGMKQEEQKIAAIPPTGAEGELLDKPDIATEPGIGGEAKVKGVKRNWKTLSLKDLSVNGDGGTQAATDDRLDGVAEGEKTILSTREFKFFSYYNRIKDLLRQHWKPNVERKLARLWSKGRNIGETEMTTKLIVTLDANGSIQKISRVESSGIDEVDAAAMEAFQAAAPFPNPPKGLIEEDGLLRVRWDFVLKTESAPIIQFRTNGVPNR
jgi:TonB family protein